MTFSQLTEMSADSPHSLRRQSGFTLIRLLVGISVMGVMLAAASPNIATVSRTYAVRSGARQVYTDLQNARMLAVMGNQSCTFTVTDSGTYTIQPSGGSLVTTPLSASSQGVTLSAPNAITFASNGTATSTATVTLASTGGGMQVAVSPAGRVRVQ
jgi:type II secretory pathway pseudopilin PulG